MPKFDGVSETSLYINDLEHSVHFYPKIFGFEVIDAGVRLYALIIQNRQILLLF
jgi:catechol-2,3-dioxygenase